MGGRLCLWLIDGWMAQDRRRRGGLAVRVRVCVCVRVGGWMGG